MTPEKLAKALSIAAIGTIFLLIAVLHGRADAEDIYTRTKRIMMRGLYQSQLASGGDVRIIDGTEKWNQDDKYLKYSLEFMVISGKTQRRCFTEITVNLKTKASVQIYRDYSKPNQIKLEAKP